MKKLVIFYSRTGNTAQLAKQISDELECDLEEIDDEMDRSGIIGFLRSGWHTVRKKKANLKSIQKDFSEYDLLVMGFPIWNSSIPPAIRTLVDQEGQNMSKIALFSTMAGRGAEKAHSEVRSLLDKKSLASLKVKKKEFENKEHTDALDEFLKEIGSYS